jgi:HSP20 family protein
MRITQYYYPVVSRAQSPFQSYRNRSPWVSFDSGFDRLFDAAFTGRSESQVPVSLFEDTQNTYLRADLPGVAKDQINVQVADGLLTIEAQRKEGEVTTSFTRSIAIPESANAEQVQAAYENGVLTVTLPKQEKAQPKKVTVSVK